MPDDGQVVWVDKGHNEGNDGIAAVVLGVGEDDELSGPERQLWAWSASWRTFLARQPRTNIASDVVVQTGEDNPALRKSCGLGLALLDDHGRDKVRNRCVELPSRRLRIRLPCRPSRGTQHMQLKVRVLS